MHELSLIADLLRKVDAVAADAASDTVLEVTVRLGALAHISPGHFRDHFTAAARGTVADGARLLVERSHDVSDPHAQEILLQRVTVAER